MAASEQLDRVIGMYRDYLEKGRGLTTIEQIRAATEEFLAPFRPAEDVRWEPVDAGGAVGEWISAPGVDGGRVLIFLHAGGYVTGSVNAHRDLIARLSRSSGARALGLDYRLAPEHPFPAALDDTLAAYHWLISNGLDAKRIVISGGSAGGGLTLAVLIALRDAGEEMPAAGVCVSSWTDLAHTGESLVNKAGVDPFVQPQVLENMAKLYLGDTDPRAPLVSPLYADLRGLPPLLIHVGSHEVLLDDSTRLAQRATEAGVDVTLEVWEDMVPDWQNFAPFLPEGQQSIDRIGEFVRAHTS